MSLFSAISVGASGMAAQRQRAELLVENLANAETTRTPAGGPYRRKDAVFASAPAAKPTGLEVKTQPYRDGRSRAQQTAATTARWKNSFSRR